MLRAMVFRRVAWFAVFVGLIVAANVATSVWGLVPAGFGLLVTAGTYAAGLALLARDFLHRAGGVPWVLAAIGVGIALSWVLATPALAVASAAAFLVSELADLAVFLGVRPRGFVTAAGVSNLVSAPVDTLVFLSVAGFPITWQTVGGQLLVKLLWGTAAPLAVYVGVRWITTRTRPRVPSNTR
jgi:uncharacterized PurR-regulated membrane protein YhhQ (DUF165 family)